MRKKTQFLVTFVLINLIMSISFASNSPNLYMQEESAVEESVTETTNGTNGSSTMEQEVLGTQKTSTTKTEEEPMMEVEMTTETTETTTEETPVVEETPKVTETPPSPSIVTETKTPEPIKTEEEIETQSPIQTTIQTTEQEAQESVVELSSATKDEITDEEMEKILNRLGSQKPISKIESLRLSDIIGEEEISEELRYKINETIQVAQGELDNYRKVIKDNYKTMTKRILDVKKELNQVQNFKDEAEYNLEVSRWMILTLSMGVICLTFLLVIMWRSVTSISKNEIEVLFAYEDLKKNMQMINEQIEFIRKKEAELKLEAQKAETGA